MTPDISCRSLIQIGLQIPRWRTKWRPCKGMAVSQAFIFHFKWYSLLPFAICQLLGWAFLFQKVSCCYIYCSKFHLISHHITNKTFNTLLSIRLITSVFWGVFLSFSSSGLYPSRFYILSSHSSFPLISFRPVTFISSFSTMLNLWYFYKFTSNFFQLTFRLSTTSLCINLLTCFGMVLKSSEKSVAPTGEVESAPLSLRVRREIYTR